MKLLILTLLFAQELFAETVFEIKCTTPKQCAALETKVYEAANKYPNLNLLTSLVGSGQAANINVKVSEDGIVSGHAKSIDSKFQINYKSGIDPVQETLQDGKVADTQKQEPLARSENKAPARTRKAGGKG